MAINKDSNGYTFGFAIVLVIVVGSILAILAKGLKPMQDRNAEVKKQMDVLSALLTKDEYQKVTRKNAEEMFAQFVDLNDAVVINYKGEVVEGVYDVDGKVISGEAFDVDIKKEFKDKKRDEKFRNYPLFVAKKDGKTYYILPIVGKGLWGPIWGNVCIGEDMTTIAGASFGHQGETPGLGAEITQQFFVNGWIDEKISVDGSFAKFEVVKDNSGATTPSKVDGITGGTITSVGVQEMANRCLGVYVPYFNNLKNQ